ncbi:MAG TPA: glycosyltransferase family 4 protein [bacterium]|nr:glycosyltransferase family 4 protein [bacterium]
MKVTVSVGGTFHAFRLAEQLEARGLLHRLVTTHRPLRGERVPASRLAVNPWPEIVMRAPRTVGLPWRAGDYVKAIAFDRWAARYTAGCDVWVGFAVFSLRAQWAARRAGARTVLERGSTHILTQYALVAEEYRRWGYSAPPVDRRLVDRQVREYDEAEYISVPSQFARVSFLDRGVAAGRLLCNPYGADTRLFAPGPSPGRPFRIVTVGLSLRKGTPYLLDAAARLGITGGRGGPEIEVYLAGAVAPDVAAVVRGARAAVRLTGALSQPRLAALYRSASVFVLPSVEEGMALSVLEALASGLPVIVTPNTGAGDLITHGREGLIIPPGDAPALAEALLSLYEDEPRRRAMGLAAAETARGWTWDAYGDRAAAAYARLIGAGVASVS